MICQKCGAKLPENTSKCPRCSAENTAAPVADKKTAPKTSFFIKKKIVITLLITVVLIAGSITAAVSLSEGSSISVSTFDMLQLADRYLKEMNYEQAIMEFQKILEIDPKNVEAYLGLSEAYEKLGDSGKAIEVLENGIGNVGNNERFDDKIAEINHAVGNSQVVTEAKIETEVIIAPATTSSVNSTTSITEFDYSSMETITILGNEYDATTESFKVYGSNPNNNVLKQVVNLTNLTELDLFNGQIDDISSLVKLTNLTELGLCGNHIADITPLVGLTNLTDLHLGNNQIIDITPLASLTNLKYLVLSGNQIADITPLTSLTNLEVLFLEDNPISEVDIVQLKSQLPNCNIYCSDFQVNEVTIAGKEYNIQSTTELTFDDNITKLSNEDIINIGKLGNLTHLTVSRQSITDISFLANLSKLRKLDLSYNDITDITQLSNLTNLTSLDLIGNEITDITPLSNLKQLYFLYLSGNQISDLTVLADLEYLLELSLKNNEIRDITPLSNHEHLVTLKLANNDITDLSSFSNLPGLVDLDLSDNEISDLTPLSSLTNLIHLYLSGNYITREDAFELYNQLPYLQTLKWR